MNGVSFGAWLESGDTLESAEATLSSQSLGGGTVYFDGSVNFTASNCFQSALGFNICQETGSFSATNLSNGTLLAHPSKRSYQPGRSGVLGRKQAEWDASPTAVLRRQKVAVWARFPPSPFQF